VRGKRAGGLHAPLRKPRLLPYPKSVALSCGRTRSNRGAGPLPTRRIDSAGERRGGEMQGPHPAGAVPALERVSSSLKLLASGPVRHRNAAPSMRRNAGVADAFAAGNAPPSGAIRSSAQPNSCFGVRLNSVGSTDYRGGMWPPGQTRGQPHGRPAGTIQAVHGSPLDCLRELSSSAEAELVEPPSVPPAGHLELLHTSDTAPRRRRLQLPQ